MKRLLKTLLLGILLSLANNVYCQSNGGQVNCGQGPQDPPQEPPGTEDSNPSADAESDNNQAEDPNEIIGTSGYDALGDTLQWVAATAFLPYTIYFENDPELATASAQKVEIRCPLHPKADISTFTVGAFGFGSHIYTVEGNRSTYQQRLDLIANLGIYVDVVAGIDIVAGEVFWVFQSIDPVSLLPPQGTQEGFLPINDENSSGEGFVTFNIKPRVSACVTGDEITAQASIVFDVNEAIATNVWHNTVDALPPTTHLVGTEGRDNEIVLQFSGQDDEGGCGIKQYKLYVSDNYGAYSLYGTYPVGTEATYPTEYDHCYRFFCLGEDNVGNVEAMKEQAEVEYGNYNLMVSVAASPEEGGTVTGEGLYTYNSQVTVTAVPAMGYEFYRWTRNGVPVSEEPTYTFSIMEEMNLVAQFVEANMSMQQFELAEGWNWWSTNIEQDGINGLEMLENGLGHNGITIKSQYDFVENYYQYYGEDFWFGSLGEITNEQGYLVDVTQDCLPSMTGIRANPSNHPITIQPNWNWIGYPVTSQQSVASALAGYNASPDDLIKSHYEFSTYYEGFGWFPEDLMMTPGQGYFYYSNATGNQTLTYGNSNREEALPDKTDLRQWRTNVHRFADNISIVAVVSIDSVEQREEELELGAFVNGECRGSARLRHFGPTNRYYALLSVTGIDGEEVAFGYVNQEKGEGSMVCENRVVFMRNDRVGSLDEPYIVRFNTQVEGLEDDFADGEDVMLLYPNPVMRNQVFTLEIPGEEVLKEFVVVDVLGEEVRHQHGAVRSTDIKGLPVAGIYFVKAVTQSGRVYYGKLIVE